jgi:hypothetical protein
VGGINGVARVYAQSGRMVWCLAAVGADSSLRVVVAHYRRTPSSAAAIDDLLNRLYVDIRPK